MKKIRIGSDFDDFLRQDGLLERCETVALQRTVQKQFAFRQGRIEGTLTKLLNERSSEREVHRFLKKHPYLIGMVFHSNTHPRGVVSEFKLGAEMRCDFLVLSCSSGWWTADLVELKSPNDRLYLKDGTPSRSLRVAKREVRDSKRWIRENERYLRNRLSKLFELKKTCASGGMNVPDAATEILDPRCVLDFKFHIVIGRRHLLTSDDRCAKVQESLDSPENLATYDRLIEAARRFDREGKRAKDGLRFWHHL